MDDKFEIAISIGTDLEEVVEVRNGIIPRIGEKIEVSVYGTIDIFIVKEVIYPENGLPRVYIDWEFAPSQASESSEGEE